MLPYPNEVLYRLFLIINIIPWVCGIMLMTLPKIVVIKTGWLHGSGIVVCCL